MAYSILMLKEKAWGWIEENKDHPFFLATQFHPEFKGRPTHPHPLFAKFVERTLALREDEG